MPCLSLSLSQKIPWKSFQSSLPAWMTTLHHQLSDKTSSWSAMIPWLCLELARLTPLLRICSVWFLKTVLTSQHSSGQQARGKNNFMRVRLHPWRVGKFVLILSYFRFALNWVFVCTIGAFPLHGTSRYPLDLNSQ